MSQEDSNRKKRVKSRKDFQSSVIESWNQNLISENKRGGREASSADSSNEREPIQKRTVFCSYIQQGRGSPSTLTPRDTADMQHRRPHDPFVSLDLFQASSSSSVCVRLAERDGSVHFNNPLSKYILLSKLILLIPTITI
jgi:hypothetical protein